MSTLTPIFVWYLVTLVATIACLPLTLYLFRKTMGKGAAFARPISMLLTIWPLWFLSSWLPSSGLWTSTLLWGFLAGTAVIGWIQVARRSLLRNGTMFHLVVSELAFVVVFFVAAWFRGFGPQIDSTEKPGELMMLSSAMHSTNMPPADAWLSGHTLNYYYFGYAIWGGIGKLSGVSPAEAFNLALVSTFAMSAVTVAGLVAMVIGRYHGEWAARVAGIAAAVITMLLGNWWSSWEWFNGRAGDSYWQGIGWNASRILHDSLDPQYGYNPITEFPSFSFILGDLHPHVMAIPFVITALGIAWVLLTLGKLNNGDSFWQQHLATIIASGAIVGSLYAINSWDFPTFAGITAFALLVGSIGIGWQRQISAVVWFVVAAVVAWLPFYLSFTSPTNAADTPIGELLGRVPVLGGLLGSIGLYKGLATSPGEFFSVFGFQYLALLVLLVNEVVRRREPVVSQRDRRMGDVPYIDPVSGYLAIGFGVLCLIGAILVPVPLLLFCGLPVIVIWLLLERDARLTPANVSLVLFALALLLLLIPEFFYIHDIYGNSRMNTVFKVSYQVWILMSVAASIGIVAVWKSVRFNVVLRYVMPAVTAIVLVFGLVYPVVAGQQWLNWRNPDQEWSGMDGLAYLKADPDSIVAAEYAAITWLLENATEDDVILTSGGGEWAPSVGRVSGGSGVPTIIGWTGHERQWHLGDDAVLTELQQRVADIDAMYGDPSAPGLLDKYGVTLLYIGPNELHGANDAQPSPGYMSTTPVTGASNPGYPGTGWELVFQQGEVRIYRRVAS